MKKTLILVAVALVAGVGIWIWGLVERGDFSTSVSEKETSARLPRGVRAGIIKLSTEFSEPFNINPAIGENIFTQITTGGLNGEMLINGNRKEQLMLGDYSLPPIKTVGVVCSIAYRNLEPGEEKKLAYWICIGTPPADWFRQVMLLEER